MRERARVEEQRRFVISSAVPTMLDTQGAALEQMQLTEACLYGDRRHAAQRAGMEHAGGHRESLQQGVEPIHGPGL